jgi:gas vesicle structural protein
MSEAAPALTPTDEDLIASRRELTLLELVDRVINKGVVLTGDITLSVADVDLIYIGLRALVSSIEAMDGSDSPEPEPPAASS